MKSYTSKIETGVNTYITIIGFSLFNDSTGRSTATADLLGSDGVLRARVLEIELEPKETIFISNKIVVGYGDSLDISGCQFIVTGDEDTV